jgi:hypothetical protein
MMAYATGQPVKSATAESRERVDYNPLLGFVSPAVRIDPHSREVEVAPQTDLQQIADIVRDRSRANPQQPHKPQE